MIRLLWKKPTETEPRGIDLERARAELDTMVVRAQFSKSLTRLEAVLDDLRHHKGTT